jgi:hypothetical protein
MLNPHKRLDVARVIGRCDFSDLAAIGHGSLPLNQYPGPKAERKEGNGRQHRSKGTGERSHFDDVDEGQVLHVDASLSRWHRCEVKEARRRMAQFLSKLLDTYFQGVSRGFDNLFGLL